MISETRRIDCSFIYRNLKFKRLLFCQGVNTIKLVVDKFKENRFAASQVENLFNFLFNVLINQVNRIIVRDKQVCIISKQNCIKHGSVVQINNIQDKKYRMKNRALRHPTGNPFWGRPNIVKFDKLFSSQRNNFLPILSARPRIP